MVARNMVLARLAASASSRADLISSSPLAVGDVAADHLRFDELSLYIADRNFVDFEPAPALAVSISRS